MFILGISCYYHDAAACILKDGEIIAAAEEERFTRKKHDISFPINAIQFCLREAGIAARQLDAVAFYEKPFLKFERLLAQHMESFPGSFWTFYQSIPSWLNEKLRLPRTLKKKLGYRGKIYFVDHHLSHAASAYLASPFQEAAILTVDGVGEWATTAYGYAKGNEITLRKEIHFPHSLGLLYSAVTAYLGFKVNNDEYKVMGLSAYGRPVYYDQLKKIIAFHPDGSYSLDMSYFVYHAKARMPSKKFTREFGPARKPESEITQRHKDMAASLQKVLEEALLLLVTYVSKETGMKNLCMAGGVALNSVANGKLLRNSAFKNLWIQPAASDAGTSLGAALYVYHSLLGNPRKQHQKTAFLGPAFSDAEIRQFLDANSIRYHTFSRTQLLRKTAQLIYQNKVVGWFQGRMEWGPRALGARSILSNPCNPQMQEILNVKVKHREPFRPFAPAVTREDAPDYFICDSPLPAPADFMLMVYPIKKAKQRLIPAVTHVDGTGRLQTVSREQHPLYHGLIKEFEKLSGIPIIINTSFNIRGEPIVCTPYDAYRCMMGTGIDALVMGPFIIYRQENPQHIWDSEKYAKD